MSVSGIVSLSHSKVSWGRRALVMLVCVLVVLSTAAVVQAEGPTPPDGKDGAKDRARGFAGDFPRLGEMLGGRGLGIGWQGAEPLQLIVDTDPGVDDAAAIVWLLSQRYRQVDVLGVVTVVGNADVENTTNNALILLEALGIQDIPVIMGAAAPLSQVPTVTPALIHGPDGLWFVGLQNPHDLSGLPADAPTFYCAQAAAHPGATVLALGPLTNLALAVQQCPNEITGLGQVIALGGSRTANAPMADTNVYQDPEAAEIVLSSGLPVTLVLLETGGQFTLGERDLAHRLLALDPVSHDTGRFFEQVALVLVFFAEHLLDHFAFDDRIGVVTQSRVDQESPDRLQARRFLVQQVIARAAAVEPAADGHFLVVNRQSPVLIR